jgi:hypothetical protein
MFTLQQVLNSLHLPHKYDQETQSYSLTGLPEGYHITITISTKAYRAEGLRTYFVNQRDDLGNCFLQEGTTNIHRLLMNIGAALYRTYHTEVLINNRIW